MKNMVYVTNVFTKPMFPNLVKGNSLVVGDNYNLEYLLELKKENFKVCINNQALINTIEERLDIVLDDNIISRVSLVPGDKVLVINPSEKIEGLKENDLLPENITFRLEEIIVDK